MFHEVVSKRTVVDDNGCDKEVSEKYLVENCESCSEAEVSVMLYLNAENEVISVKQTKLKEFVNARSNDEQFIYISTIEDTYVDDSGKASQIKYSVALFATSVKEATQMTIDYMKQGLSDMSLTSVKKTKFVELLTYTHE